MEESEACRKLIDCRGFLPKIFFCGLYVYVLGKQVLDAFSFLYQFVAGLFDFFCEKSRMHPPCHDLGRITYHVKGKGENQIFGDAVGIALCVNTR